MSENQNKNKNEDKLAEIIDKLDRAGDRAVRYLSTRDRLQGLALSAAMRIVTHSEIAVILGGSDGADKRNPIDVLRDIILDTMVSGLDYTPLGPPHPTIMSAEELVPAPRPCRCGHEGGEHFQRGPRKDECTSCGCVEYMPTKTGEPQYIPVAIRGKCECGHLEYQHHLTGPHKGTCCVCECLKFKQCSS